MDEDTKPTETPEKTRAIREPITVPSNTKPDSAPRRRARAAKEAPTTSKETPRPTSKSAQDREVEAALATMRNTYDLLGMGLLTYDPTLAAKWAVKAENLLTLDASLFEADASLRQMILRFSAKSSKGTFIVAHLQAVAPFALIVATEWRAKRAKARKEKIVEVPADEAAFVSQPVESYPNASYFE